jgi:hypothetical protein
MELGVVLTANALNPYAGDLALDESGHEIVRTEMSDQVHQRLVVRLSYFRGEWFLDLSEGTPYFQHILVKAPTDRAIRTVFGSVIRGTEGVAELLSLTYSISRTRVLSLSFSVRCVDGSVLRIVDYAPFVVDDDALEAPSP